MPLFYMIGANTVPEWSKSLRYQIVADVEQFMNLASCNVRRSVIYTALIPADANRVEKPLLFHATSGGNS